MDLTQWKQGICTASSMCDDKCETMLPIKMETIKGYRFDEILKASEQSQIVGINGEDTTPFRPVLGKILNGTEPDWFLWDVVFEADSLKLSYFCRTARKSSDGHDVHPNAVVILKYPIALGLQFTVPELGHDRPEMAYECWMSGSGVKNGAHNIRLVEINTKTKRSAELNLSTRYD